MMRKWTYFFVLPAAIIFVSTLSQSTANSPSDVDCTATCYGGDELLKRIKEDKQYYLPPLVPVENASLVINGTFDRKCKRLVSDTYSPVWTSVNYFIVTESRDWGQVWRADLYVEKSGTHRAVCWFLERDSEEVVFYSSRIDSQSDLEELRLPRMRPYQISPTDGNDE